MKITAHLLPNKADAEADFRLSVSKAKTFENCKAKYKFSYIQKLPKKEWDFHIFGKFAHEILENFHIKLLENPSLDFANLMTECFKISVDNFAPKITKEQKDEAWNILNVYLNQITKQKENNKLPKVISVEKHFYIDINGKVLLNGFIDRVQEDLDGVIHVADYKTTKNKKYLTDYFQLLTYAFALMLDDPNLESIRASYVMLRHDFEFITKEFTREEVMPVAEKFLKYASEIEQEKLWEPSPQFLCKYCDFLENCKDGQKYLIKRGIIKESGYGLSEW